MAENKDTQESQPLTDDERAELERYRAEKQNPQAQQPPEEKEPENLYWLLLGNGKVVESTGQMTHYRGIQVVACTPIVEEESADA